MCKYNQKTIFTSFGRELPCLLFLAYIISIVWDILSQNLLAICSLCRVYAIEGEDHVYLKAMAKVRGDCRGDLGFKSQLTP